MMALRAGNFTPQSLLMSDMLEVGEYTIPIAINAQRGSGRI
jgi:hypothetical protein